MGTVYFYDYTFLNFPKLLTISVHFTINHSVHLTIKTLINALFLTSGANFKITRLGACPG